MTTTALDELVFADLAGRLRTRGLKYKATAGFGDQAPLLLNCADAMDALLEENRRLRVSLAEVDGLIDEYVIDVVGTGPAPSKKEQARVNATVERAITRHAQRTAALPNHTRREG